MREWKMVSDVARNVFECTGGSVGVAHQEYNTPETTFTLYKHTIPDDYDKYTVVSDGVERDGGTLGGKCFLALTETVPDARTELSDADLDQITAGKTALGITGAVLSGVQVLQGVRRRREGTAQ